MDDSPISRPAAGWYLLVDGSGVDLEDLCHSLNAPFDPSAQKLDTGETVLWSNDLQGTSDPLEVRRRGLTIIEEVNGAMRAWARANQVRLSGVLQVDTAGERKVFNTGEAAIELERMVMRSTATVDSDGRPVPTRVASKPQMWLSLAQADDKVSDLLHHHGRANNWFDLYKTIEMAEAIVGGERKLVEMFAGSVNVKLLKRSANVYRHAPEKEVKNRVDITEARSQLAYIVTTILDELPSPTA